jgi:hypothetical protein
MSALKTWQIPSEHGGDPLIVSMRMPVITVTLPGGAQGDLSRKQAEWLSCYLENAVDWLTDGEEVSGEDISDEDG